MKLNILVKKIIEENDILNQKEITNILKKKYDIGVTQSNISRILKQINAVKVVRGKKNTVYEIQGKLKETVNWVKELIKKIDDNGYFILITGYPGSANIIGQIIDENPMENLMGTIAGDNSLLVLPKDVTKIEELKIKLEKLLI
jgi:transcriptional regulator of arginine metabolism